jgi:hypothetical protein
MGVRRGSRKATIRKVVDEEIVLGRPRRGAKLREEVWEDSQGRVVKYNLAYINPSICSVDHGRVLGYDNNHGSHHRHIRGVVEPVVFEDYESLALRFREEVLAIWREEEYGSDS